MIALSPVLRRILNLTCGVALIAIIGGCATTFKETYYVGVIKKDSRQPLQFYRFKMAGHATFGSKVKFESGWYPAAALEFTVGENRTLHLYPYSENVAEKKAWDSGKFESKATPSSSSALIKLEYVNETQTKLLASVLPRSTATPGPARING